MGSTGTGVDFILEKWKQLMNTPLVDKDQVESLYEGLRSLKTFLMESEMIRYDHQTLQHLVNQIIDLAYEAENLYYSFMVLRPMIAEKISDIAKVMQDIRGIVENQSYYDKSISIEKLMKLLNYHQGHPLFDNTNNFVQIDKDKIQSLYEDWGFLRTFLIQYSKIRRISNNNDCETPEKEQVEDLVNQIKYLICQAKDDICCSIIYSTTLEKVMLIRTAATCSKESSSRAGVDFLLEKVKKLITTVQQGIYWRFMPSSSKSSSIAGINDFLLMDLWQLIKCEGEEDEDEEQEHCVVKNDQINSLYKDLDFLRYFLVRSKMIRTVYKPKIVKDLVHQVKYLTYQAISDVYWSVTRCDRIEEMKSIKTAVMEIYDKELYGIGNQPVDVSSSNRSSLIAGVDFLLGNLKQLLEYERGHYLFCPIKTDQIRTFYEELGSVMPFLSYSVMTQSGWKPEIAKYLQHILEDKLIDLAYDTNLFIEQSSLCNILKELESIKAAVTEIYDKKSYGIGDPQVRISSSAASYSRAGDPNVEKETVVGFDRELYTIKERLAGGSKQLDVISIVGMAGLGKTTLAKKLYSDSFVLEHFYTRGWISVSQSYRKTNLLLEILHCIVEREDEIYTIIEEKLGEELYKRLKGRRYLIVIDDLWNIGAWADLRVYFPNDNNGSRILLTSRCIDVALKVKPDSPPHHLRFLSEDESWDLLQQKVFRKESCPPYLVEIGRQIAQKCEGLPLAIVVIAGLLAKTNKKQDWWRQVARRVSSHVASDLAEQCMDTLALSYNHLPRHLQECFLYFGAFPEDFEICVRKLIWLWIAEGFIHRIGQRSLEDVAEEYLMDLIDRSLVLVAKKRSTGGVKVCRVHDMLRDLCLRKSKEQNFMQHIFWTDEWSASSSSLVPIGEKYRRLCIHPSTIDYSSSLNPSASYVRSFLCFSDEQSPSSPNNMLYIYKAFKFLKVLDLSEINISHFPSPILSLVLQGKNIFLPGSISNLLNLETLIISKAISNIISPNVWKIVKLRHLRMGGENDIGFPFVYPHTLNNLQTISQVCPSKSLENVLARTPNLRKLGLCVNFSRGQHFSSLRLGSLNHLEVLCLLIRHRNGQLNSFEGLTFPPNLKRLTLSNTGLQWEEMSILGMLPNLEALKLEYKACVGPRWDTSDGGFRRLKYLRVHYMTIQQWDASSNHFPNLEHLVLSSCKELEAIPFDFGNIYTLHTLEVSWCSYSAVMSARQIQEEQETVGNDWLKIIINLPE